MEASKTGQRLQMNPTWKLSIIMESRRETSLQAEQAASRFIAQRETGPWSEQDDAEFQKWLSESTLHRVLYYRLNATWQEAGRLKALGAGPRPSTPFLTEASNQTAPEDTGSVDRIARQTVPEERSLAHRWVGRLSHAL